MKGKERLLKKKKPPNFDEVIDPSS